ncbi:nucleoside-diphosphate sugar epimerase/dehydratase [uncultured Desulfuromonas sp.]|uniref:polysaccharide biosynthesis protein n=1 Tax=uncultured Desulfuromonas sp. TaxID=181013 RepID=UPI002AAA647A|nr:nucleoside-diphosphate sugar epimerase/dehydratase [uncultured Desulfuromonas sp.]
MDFLLIQRRLFVIFPLQLFLVVCSLYCAFLVRFDFSIPDVYLTVFYRILPAVIVIKLFVFGYFKLYSGWWRYVSMSDLVVIFKANFIGSAGVIVYNFFVYRLELVSRTILFLDGLFCFLLVAGIRFSIRAFRENFYPMPVNKAGKTRMLIVGAGDAGQMIARELRLNRKLSYDAIGFIDDDRRKQNTRFRGLPVLGTCDDILSVCRKKRIEEVIIAIPSATGKQIRTIVEYCQKANVRFKKLPGVGGLLDGSVSVEQIKDVSLEDLLGREAVRLDGEKISSYLCGKRVLVTGAGGSIGSELCRQIAYFCPNKLILFENGETPLFSIEQELKKAYPKLLVYPIIGDIRYRSRVEAIFDEFMPEVVFHAAAYKHVPMMEVNPAEAVNNNVRGTQVVAEMAHIFRVERFVMVSTDKAVNPTSVMGATKRAAEKLVQALSCQSQTRFVTVRFGNVLGSNGSVIPTFKEQIRHGGPLTVTHKEITRFFMTIPEATQLVLQAGSMGNGGEIYLLDMGEPVKILHLAEELIRLSGKVPYDDIDIVFSGLRPGEKLYEELLLDGEGIKPTTHEKICVAQSVTENDALLNAQLEHLFEAARKMDLRLTVDLLEKVVPEYQPAQHNSVRNL